MTESWIHPSAVLLLGAAILPLLPRAVRRVLIVLVPVLAFGAVLLMQGHNGVYGVVPFMNWELTFGRVDALSMVFAYIMTLMCVIGSIYGLHVEEAAQHSAAWIYVAGSLGVIFCGDYLTLFLFWEIMAFSSVFLVWFRRRKQFGWASGLAGIAGARCIPARRGPCCLLAGPLCCPLQGHGPTLPILDRPSRGAPNRQKNSWYHPTLIMHGVYPQIRGRAAPCHWPAASTPYAEATGDGPRWFMCAFTTKNRRVTCLAPPALRAPWKYWLAPAGRVHGPVRRWVRPCLKNDASAACWPYPHHQAKLG